MRTIRPLTDTDWEQLDALLSPNAEGFTVAEYAARQGISFTGAHGKLEIARAQGKLTRERAGGASWKYRLATKEKRV